MIGRAWTSEEEQSLIVGALQGESIGRAAVRFNRSINSIERKRKGLRKQKRLPNFHGRSWKADDETLIRLVRQGMKDAEIAPLLDRTAIAVEVRRKILFAPQKPAEDCCAMHVVISAWRDLDGVRMRTLEGVG